MGCSNGGGGSGGGKGSKAPKQIPTKAKIIENMNEAQLDEEIQKAEDRLKRYQAVMDRTRGGTEYDRAMQDNFPLGVGGSGWNKSRREQFNRNNERGVENAKAFTDAYNNAQAEQRRLDNLRKAKSQISGTGKTQRQLRDERAKQAKQSAKSAKPKTPKSTTKWAKDGKGGISAGGFNIQKYGNDGYAIYRDGKFVTFASTQAAAKAIAETYINK